MHKNEFALRERKYGDKRFEILLSFTHELENKNINSISVESICDKVQISKVTFFKYFRSKEEVLYYYIHMWQYNLSYAIHMQTYFGINGILNVFKSVAEQKYSINFMLAIIQYFIKLDSPPKVMDITDYEYYLFHKQAYGLKIEKLNLREILIHYLKDIPCDDMNITFENLISAFYGIPLTAHILDKKSELFEMYKNSVLAILK